jgi:hypothetical protein
MIEFFSDNLEAPLNVVMQAGEHLASDQIPRCVPESAASTQRPGELDRPRRIHCPRARQAPRALRRGNGIVSNQSITAREQLVRQATSSIP